MSDQRSSWAVGYAAFAGVMLLLVGTHQIMVGLVAIVNEEYFAATEKYIFRFDVTTWGWIHLIVGVLAIASGVGIYSGNVLSRIVGVIAAVVSGLAAFAWIPYDPFWGIVLVALSVGVIWALTAHGSDLAEERGIN